MYSDWTEKMRVSGYETENVDWIKKKLHLIFETVHSDAMGNIYAKKGADPAKKTLLLATHWDEPGFIVTKITDEGYLKFDIVGEIPAEALLSKKVKIHGNTGVISLKAIHLSTKKEREKPVDKEKLFVDIGAKNEKEAREIAMEGDYFTFEQSVCEVGSLWTGRGVDSAAAMEILISVAQKIDAYNLILLFYAQHHLGMRGLQAAAANLEADFCLMLEGMDWKKRLGEEKEERAEAGNSLCYATQNFLMPSEWYVRMKEAVSSAGIPVQFDAAEIQDEAEIFAATGIPVGYIGLNCRYQNTAVCAVKKEDIKNAEKMILTIAEEIK